MKNKLHLTQKTVRLICAWVATGDAKKPLACVWGAAKTPCAASAEAVNAKTTRMHLCA